MIRVIPLLILISLLWGSCSLGTGQADIVNIIVEESDDNIVFDSDFKELSISSLSVGGSSATITLPALDSSIYLIIVHGNDEVLNSSWSDDILTISDLSAETNYTFMVYAFGISKNQMLCTAFTTLADGEAEDEYTTISTREELKKIGNEYSLSGNYLLIEDIDLSGEDWEPIGNFFRAFTGCFVGNNHVISNLTIDNSTADYLGFFGYIGRDASLCNLGLQDIDVTGELAIGGLVGYNYFGSITSCYSTGVVNGHDYTGGLVGTNSGSITSCYSTGAVNGVDFTGGLVGMISGSAGSITSCFSTGAVTGTNYTGGLVGDNDSGTGSIISCYSTGAVNGVDFTGGLVGTNSGSITSCYYDRDSSDQNDNDGRGTPLSTAEMKLEDSYNDTYWDFTETWGIDNSEAINSGYPYLTNLIPGE